MMFNHLSKVTTLDRVSSFMKKRITVGVVGIVLALLIAPTLALAEKGAPDLTPYEGSNYGVLDPSVYTRVPSASGESGEATPAASKPEQAWRPEEDGERSRTWFTIKTEGFEGAWPNQWQCYRGTGATDAYWGNENDGHQYTGDMSGYCADDGSAGIEPPGPYRAYMDAWMVYGPFSLQNTIDADMDFYHWTQTEYGYDRFSVWASVDGVNFYGHYWTGDWSGWNYYSFDLTNVYTLGNLCGQSQVWIAFHFDSDCSVQYEGTYLDDIVLWKNVCCDLSIEDWWFEQNGLVVPPNCLDITQAATLKIAVKNWCPYAIEIEDYSLGIYPRTPLPKPQVVDRSTLPGGQTRTVVPGGQTIVDTLFFTSDDLTQYFGLQCSQSYDIQLGVYPSCGNDTYPSDNYYTKTIDTCPCCCDVSLDDWWFEQSGQVIPPNCLDITASATLNVEVRNWCPNPIEVTTIWIESVTPRAALPKTPSRWLIPGYQTVVIELQMTPEDIAFYFDLQCGQTYDIELSVEPECIETYPWDNDHTETIDTCPCSEASWTFMVFLNSDNNLESAGLDDLNEMEAIGSDSCLNIVTQIDRIPGYDSTNGDWTGCRRYYVTSDPNGYDNIITSQLVQNLGECDMGDPNELFNFVTWAISNYPADHYALVIWNHGSGWKLKDPIEGGISYDDTSQTFMTLSDTEWALGQIHSWLGREIDVLGYDACLMAMLEVDYASAPHALFRVASEETEPGDGWDYVASLGWLKANCPTATPQQLADRITNDYWNFYGATPPETQSSVDLSDIRGSDIAGKVDTLASYLIANMGTFRTALDSVWSAVKRYYDPSFADLYHFCQLLYNAVGDATLQGHCQNVMNAVSTAVSVARGGVNDHGISIYLPQTCPDYWTSYATQCSFAQDKSWDEFLSSYLCGSACSITVTSPNGGESWQVGSSHNITWTSQDAGSTVKIEYSTNGGSSWTTITGSTTDDGSYQWTVPSTPSTHSLVRICSVSDPSCCDTSDSEFTISGGVCDPNFQRTIAPQCVVQAAGGTFTVTVQITADRDFTGLALDEDLVGFPEDWSPWQVTPIQNDGAAYNANEVQWLWLSVSNGETKTIVYEVTVPAGQPLGAYTINGVVQSGLPVFSGSVCGDNQVTVAVSCGYSIDYVVAHWVSGALDPNDPCEISLTQILQAIAWWANGTPVPNTGGQTIDLTKILDLIAKWANGTCIDSSSAPQSLSLPKALPADEAASIANAARSITSTTGGLAEVTVTVEAKQAITGLALDENLPEGWIITPIDNAGATFNAQETQWLWLEVSAGETKTVRYQVEIPSDASLDELYEIAGFIRAASPSLVLEVVGDVQLGERLPGGKLEVVAIPNPVRDVHTVTFHVRGALVPLVETIRVQIFNLAGRLVYEKQEAGTSLDWHTDDSYGEYLANGIYLYKLYALVEGKWVVSEVKKLAILR